MITSEYIIRCLLSLKPLLSASELFSPQVLLVFSCRCWYEGSFLLPYVVFGDPHMVPPLMEDAAASGGSRTTFPEDPTTQIEELSEAAED